MLLLGIIYWLFSTVPPVTLCCIVRNFPRHADNYQPKFYCYWRSGSAMHTGQRNIICSENFRLLITFQVHDGKNLKGRANDAIASACLYIACRQEGVPRTFKEICAVSKISKKEIGRCFKLILKALETSVDLITTADFMSRFCSNLGLPNSVQRAATHIARKAGELDIVSGRSPISVAAAAIYMASQVSFSSIYL